MQRVMRAIGSGGTRRPFHTSPVLRDAHHNPPIWAPGPFKKSTVLAWLAFIIGGGVGIPLFAREVAMRKGGYK
ncbi:Cytochrome c oxidase polypeptide VIIc [Plasmodiophora brassicae]|uniref:Uncharacterized protein n=1 Tax=Plasmodiophora brassicae TaxID=37360 RepID=A0A0G4IP86_PLABS|nr:hypothetical protein PBRA_005601 [Plasmodiophora brassicae]SPR00978.1 unnamed protein product [Plasmodiophora brassicae]